MAVVILTTATTCCPMKIYYNDDGTLHFGDRPEGVPSTYMADSSNEWAVPAMATYYANQETNQANKELAQEQNRWNYHMWEEENAYNTPKAQLERYLDAGINPLFASIDGGQASSLSSAQLANQQAPNLNGSGVTKNTDQILAGMQQALGAIDGILGYQMQAKQLDLNQQNLDLQRIIGEANIGKTKAETKGIGIDNTNKQREYDDRHEQAVQALNIAKQEERITTAEADKLEACLPTLIGMTQEEYTQLKLVTDKVRKENQGLDYDNQVKKVKAEFAQKTGVNPDAEGWSALIQLFVNNPAGVGQLINDITSGLKTSVKDVFNDNEIVQKAEEMVKDFTDYTTHTIPDTWRKLTRHFRKHDDDDAQGSW